MPIFVKCVLYGLNAPINLKSANLFVRLSSILNFFCHYSINKTIGLISKIFARSNVPPVLVDACY